MEEVVLAREHVAVLEVADTYLVKSKAICTLVPVVVVSHVNIITIVVTAASPEGTTVEYRHLAPFGVRLVHSSKAIVTGEFRCMSIFVIQLRHALDTDFRAVLQLEQVLTQIKLEVLLAFVTQAILGLCPWKLKARLPASLR
ncbi:hypothetical protein D3C75_1037850 [compost metagenome]